MYFSKIASLVGIVSSGFFGQCAAAPTSTSLEVRALSASQLVNNINNITQQSETLLPIVSKLTTGETAISRRQTNPFQPMVDGYQKLYQTEAEFYNQQSGTTAYTAAEASQVCAAYTRSVAVQQELLKITIGKSGLLEGFFTGPVAAALRSFDSTSDEFAFGIANLTPSCETDIFKSRDRLSETLGKAICAYTPGGSLGVDLFC